MFRTWWEKIGIESKNYCAINWQLGSQFTSTEDGSSFRHVNGSKSHTSRAFYFLGSGGLPWVLNIFEERGKRWTLPEVGKLKLPLGEMITCTRPLACTLPVRCATNSL